MSGIAQARVRAARFVEERGDPAAVRRAAVLIGAEPLAGAQSALEEWAERSGVFRAPGGVDPRAALPVLRGLADLRALDCPLALRIAEALAKAQADDGSFGAAGSDEEERVYLTGRLAACLSGLRSVRQRLLDGAADHLAALFTPERVSGFAWRPLAAYTPLFTNVEHERADDVLQWCGRELERGFRAKGFDAVQAARIWVDCGAASLPGAKLAAGEIVLALLAEQAGDGGWPAPGGGDAAARVAHTLDALTALVRLA
ncbi:MAG TPA: hypothetical protein VII72_07980 [Myxococcota bacterium]